MKQLFLASLLLLASTANANTISTNVFVDDSFGNSVQYVDFHVTDSGFFSILASEPNGSDVNPYMILFANPVSFLTGIEGNDDGGAGDNAFIDRNLNIGSYVLAVSTSQLSLTEAVFGYNPAVTSRTDGLVNITISSNDGTATFDNPSAVPVPAAAWLFGTGLLGLAGLRKRKSA